MSDTDPLKAINAEFPQFTAFFDEILDGEGCGCCGEMDWGALLAKFRAAMSAVKQ